MGTERLPFVVYFAFFLTGCMIERQSEKGNRQNQLNVFMSLPSPRRFTGSVQFQIGAVHDLTVTVCYDYVQYRCKVSSSTFRYDSMGAGGYATIHFPSPRSLLPQGQ